MVALRVVDRFARRPAFMVLHGGSLVGTLACDLATSDAISLATRSLSGAFGGGLGGMAVAIIGDVSPEERQGRAMPLVVEFVGALMVNHDPHR